MGNQHQTDQYSKNSQNPQFQHLHPLFQQEQRFQADGLQEKMVKGGRVVTKNASKNVFNGSLHDRKEETKMKSHESPKSSPLPSHNILEEDYNPSLKKLCSINVPRQANQDDNQDFLLQMEGSAISIREQDVFDYYKIKRYMGKDEHKTTLQVQSIEDQQIRCLKIIPKIYFRERELMSGENEINNLSKISHKSVVKLLQVFENINTYFLIFQYIQGHNLLELMSSQDCSEELCKQIVMKVLTVLQVIHSRGIVHRDIRLQNIILYHQNNNLEIKIISFGFSIDLGHSKFAKHPYGELFYAPPESYDGMINQKYDIWSVGILVLLMFTCNARPTNLKKLQICQLAKKRAVLRQEIKKISENVKVFVMDLLVTKNKRRPTAEKALALEWLSGLRSQKRRPHHAGNLDEELLYKF